MRRRFKVITKKVKIREIKDSETISRKEYKRLEIGVSAKSVKKITDIKDEPKVPRKMGTSSLSPRFWNRVAELSIWDGKLLQNGVGRPIRTSEFRKPGLPECHCGGVIHGRDCAVCGAMRHCNPDSSRNHRDCLVCTIGIS